MLIVSLLLYLLGAGLFYRFMVETDFYVDRLHPKMGEKVLAAGVSVCWPIFSFLILAIVAHDAIWDD